MGRKLGGLAHTLGGLAHTLGLEELTGSGIPREDDPGVGLAELVIALQPVVDLGAELEDV